MDRGRQRKVLINGVWMRVLLNGSIEVQENERPSLESIGAQPVQGATGTRRPAQPVQGATGTRRPAVHLGDSAPRYLQQMLRVESVVKKITSLSRVEPVVKKTTSSTSPFHKDLDGRELIDKWQVAGDTLEAIKRTARGFNVAFLTIDLTSIEVPNGWLTDNVIEVYLQLVIQSARKLKSPKNIRLISTNTLQIFSVHGYSIIEGGVDDLSQYDLVLLPLNVTGSHWTLATVDPRTWNIDYYDSNRFPSMDVSECVKSLIKKFLREVQQANGPKGASKDQADPSAGRVKLVQNAPIQTNAHDCGVFVCKFAECVALDKPMHFRTTDMPNFRREIIRDLARGTIGEAGESSRQFQPRAGNGTGT